MTHFVLTTSFPTYPGEAAGHFVEAEALALLRHGPVTVLAAGREKEPHGGPLEVTWLGGRALFGWPGALPRLKRRPWVICELPGILRRARHALTGKRGHLVAHWILPFGLFAARLQRKRAPFERFQSLQVVAHGSDVRLLLALPGLFRHAILHEIFLAHAELRFVAAELRDELAAALPKELAEYVRKAHVEPAALALPLNLPSREQARFQLGLDGDRPVVLFVGRLVDGKRPRVALEAAMLIPEARVYCLGDGPERNRLERGFTEVHFLGQVDRTTCMTWMRAADLLISSSRLEGSPGGVREALALGIPVVAVPAGDLKERAALDSNLWLVGGGRPLSDAIE